MKKKKKNLSSSFRLLHKINKAKCTPFLFRLPLSNPKEGSNLMFNRVLGPLFVVVCSKIRQETVQSEASYNFRWNSWSKKKDHEKGTQLPSNSH